MYHIYASIEPVCEQRNLNELAKHIEIKPLQKKKERERTLQLCMHITWSKRRTEVVVIDERVCRVDQNQVKVVVLVEDVTTDGGC